MARFCTKCGRPLAEGEICNCDMQYQRQAQGQSQAQAQAQAGKAAMHMDPYGDYIDWTKTLIKHRKTLLEELKSLFQKPMGTIHQLCEDGRQNTGLSMMAIYLVACIIFELCIYRAIRSGLEGALSSIPFASMMALSSANPFSIILPITLLIIASKAADILLLKGITRLFRGQVSYMNLMISAGSVSALRALPLLLSGILIMLNANVGSVLYMVSFMMGSLFANKAYENVVNLNDEKKTYAFIIARILRAFVIVLLLYLFNK